MVDLKRAGVNVSVKSSHSKCVVVDDEIALVGSANVNSTHQDFSVFFEGKGVGKIVLDYIEKIST